MEVPYIDYLTLKQASLHDVMLAYEMDGKPLPREHGAPVRLIIPEMYGYKNVKWLTGINLVPQERARLLGAARLRPGRLGRPLERVRNVKKAGYVPRFSPVERLLHWVNAARLLLPPRDRADPLPPAPLGPRLAAADDPEHPLLGRRRLARRARRRRRPRRAPPARHRARARLVRPRRPALAARRQGAAGQVQRRPEDQRGRSPPPSRSCSASPGSCSGSASRTRASASRAP